MPGLKYREWMTVVTIDGRVLCWGGVLCEKKLLFGPCDGAVPGARVAGCGERVPLETVPYAMPGPDEIPVFDEVPVDFAADDGEDDTVVFIDTGWVTAVEDGEVLLEGNPPPERVPEEVLPV